MNKLRYMFEVLEPETPEAMVPSPQMLVFCEGVHTVKVIVYFMANSALVITGGVARSAMGKIKLQYKAHSPSGAYNASIDLRKVMFTFPETQGMARQFEFEGELESYEW